VRDDLAEGRFPAADQVPVQGRPNYFQRGERHPPHSGSRRYLDLESRELIDVSPDAE
jgi:hypothetical protein